MNESTAVIINLLGGVALLLWGVRMVRTGVMRAWGDRLRNFIEQRLGNRFSALLGGGVGTAILGSGTAMTLIVAGIAASGAIGTALGLAVLLGADVGSAVVSGLFASGSSFTLWASPILLFAGYVTFSYSEEFRPHNVGRILIGLGLMLLSLQLIKQASAPLSTASLFHEVLTAVGSQPLLAFIIGAVLAWLFHSTLAGILLIAAFLANGSLDVSAALAFILGINFGGGMPAVTATLAMSAEARRLPFANLFCRGLAAIIGIGFIDRLVPYVALSPLRPVETAVGFHAAFNIATALVFLPLTRPVEWLMKRLLPDERPEEDRLATPRYLDAKSLATPPVALSNALLETVRMSELLDRMFDTALQSLRTGKLESLKLLKTLDERLNTYQTALQSYLADLAQRELSPAESRRALELTLYISNLEHAGDVIQLNLADRIKSKSKESIDFSVEQQAALDNLCLIIHDNLRLATGVLSSGDVEGAKRLIAQKDAFRSLYSKVLDDHFRAANRRQQGALRRSALYVDLIRDLHRINSLIVQAGYPIADAAGVLRGSRLLTSETSVSQDPPPTEPA
ncbi:MAG: Na/Pi cotransporter family protein [Caldilineaceae bacterium]|nr:Na/Pi cotransporter family protein [Caldilineaceae bacterium]